MEGEHERKIISLVILTLLFACVYVRYRQDLPKTDSSLGGSFPYICDSLVDGDLVCRLGDGYFSPLFRKMNGQDARFSHVGIIAKEAGDYFVIHSEADELTGVGCVQKERLSNFLSEAHDFAYYSMRDTILSSKVCDEAKACHLKNIPFDTEFDAANDSALYCTELVASCLRRAGGVELSPSGCVGKVRFFRIADLTEVYKYSVCVSTEQ